MAYDAFNEEGKPFRGLPSPRYQLRFFSGADYDAHWQSEPKNKTMPEPGTLLRPLQIETVEHFDPLSHTLPDNASMVMIFDRWLEGPEALLGLYSYGTLLARETAEKIIAHLAFKNGLEPPALGKNTSFVLTGEKELCPVYNTTVAVVSRDNGPRDYVWNNPQYTPPLPYEKPRP